MINQSSPPPGNPTSHIDREMLERALKDSAFHHNISQEIITTTVDKLTIFLLKYREILKTRTEWVAPAGIFIALLVTIVTTAEFKPFLNVKPHVWEASFLLACSGSLLWLICTIIKLVKYWGMRDLDNMIQKLKEGNKK